MTNIENRSRAKRAILRMLEAAEEYIRAEEELRQDLDQGQAEDCRERAAS